MGRARRKCPERRLQWESGSDSSSSSGSVRPSRGSWGSWSSGSSLEGDRDPNRHSCRRENIQYNPYPKEPESYMNYTNKRQEQTQWRCTKALQRFLGLHFLMALLERLRVWTEAVLVRAGPEQVTGASGVEETWSLASVPLTNEFRYNMSESLPFVPHSPTYDSFPWSSQCSGQFPYSDPTSCMPTGNENYQNAFPCAESQSVSQCQQPFWGEGAPHINNSTWDSSSCAAGKPYFSGTRSLSPMSSLFGSIWTPQSEPHPRHFHPEHSAPVSPHTNPGSPHTPISPVSPVCPATGFSREPGGACPAKHFTSFNPFGPHMNLDIWNSSSNRSSNSQLSNDSGFCGDM
ncbi:hypothetical protein DNTS_021509 [Danionella cerebrum]|uniref:Uncharacterized protein n=1 Tax=Danionella cerebrum TaxID=2873325 RepID=A0A553QZD3_9TELE|nr:hypothetical protein DNTS_021509 [Danionella translucida]